MIKEDWLTPNPQSRPRSLIEAYSYIVIHWTESPGKSAKTIRDYFESLKNQNIRYGSAHVAIDDRDIIKIIPENEVAYHAGAHNYPPSKYQLFGNKYPNSNSLAIELCHPDATGKFNPSTLYQAKLYCAFWCFQYSLNPLEKIIRHYDITGKNCPKYFIEHELEFKNFKEDIYRIVGAGFNSLK